MASTAVLELILRLRDEASGKLDDFTEKAQRADRVSGGFFSNLASTAGGFLAANIIGGISNQIGDLASSMISGNAEFERYQVQFGVLMGDAEQAKARLAELAEFGAKTPFELPEVVRADKILQAFGLHSLDAAKKFKYSGVQIRTIAGDVAAGTGASFEEIATYLGKFSSGATGEAISRMQELGIVTRQQLADMGLEFSKSGELLSPIDESMTVLLKAMEEKFGGMMTAQSSTFEGMVSNLQDWIGQTKRTLGAPLFEVLKDKLGVLLTFLNTPEVQGAIAVFAERLASGLEIALTAVGRFIETVRFLGLYLQDALIRGQYWSDWIYGLPGSIQPAVEMFGRFLSLVLPGFTMLSIAVATARAAWDSNFGGIRDLALEAWAEIQPALMELSIWLREQLPGAIQQLRTAWAQLQGDFLLAQVFIATSILPALNSLWGKFSIDGPVALGQTQSFLGQVTGGFMAFWAFVQGSIIPLLEALANVIIPAVSKTLEALAIIWQENVYPAVQVAAEAFMAFPWDETRQGIDAITAALGPLADAINQIDPRQMAEAFKYVATGGTLQAFEQGAALFGGARASGGPVSAGSAYLVGEHGQELFVPGSSGVILPAPATAAALAGGGAPSISITFNNPVIDSDARAQAVIQQAVQAVLQLFNGATDSLIVQG